MASSLTICGEIQKHSYVLTGIAKDGPRSAEVKPKVKEC